MPLSDKEKTDARDALALALELNEPETMIEGLKRLCVKKALDARLGDYERKRFQLCADALIDVQSELGRDNAPKARLDDNDAGLDGIDRHAPQPRDAAAPTPQGEQQPDS